MFGGICSVKLDKISYLYCLVEIYLPVNELPTLNYLITWLWTKIPNLHSKYTWQNHDLGRGWA